MQKPRSDGCPAFGSRSESTEPALRSLYPRSLLGKAAPKTITTETQRTLREHREGAKSIFRAWDKVSGNESNLLVEVEVEVGSIR
jgi:hypothetical protein